MTFRPRDIYNAATSLSSLTGHPCSYKKICVWWAWPALLGCHSCEHRNDSRNPDSLKEAGEGGPYRRKYPCRNETMPFAIIDGQGFDHPASLVFCSHFQDTGFPINASGMTEKSILPASTRQKYAGLRQASIPNLQTAGMTPKNLKHTHYSPLTSLGTPAFVAFLTSSDNTSFKSCKASSSFGISVLYLLYASTSD